MGSSGKSGGTASPLTTKGDVWGFSTVNARIPVGPDTQVLTADSTQTLGLKWAAPSATASNANEVQAAVLVNATSAGDAGGRSDHFTGSVLAAKWTKSANAQATVKNSVASMYSSSGLSYIDQPFTPSGDFRIEARMGGGSGGALAVFTTSGSDTGAIIINLEKAQLNVYGNSVITSEGIAGNYSGLQAGAGGNNVASIPVYLALQRASGVWTGWGSFDRVSWVQIASWSEARTITTLGFRLGGGSAQPVFCDFIDVVS